MNNEMIREYPELYNDAWLNGPDGNAYCIIGYVVDVMKKEGASRDKIELYKEYAMMSDYDNLLKQSREVIDEYNLIHWASNPILYFDDAREKYDKEQAEYEKKLTELFGPFRKYSLLPDGDFSGVDGNAVAIMGYVTKAMRREGYTEKDIEEYRNDAMSGPYDYLLMISIDMVRECNMRAFRGYIIENIDENIPEDFEYKAAEVLTKNLDEMEEEI